MFWTKEHDVILLRELVNLNLHRKKKGSTQRSMWEKVVEALNNCTSPAFNVDKRWVHDHVGILVNRYKKNLRAEEKLLG